MAEAQFHIRHAGPHVTIQDGGRPGLSRFGVPASGAMDRVALILANAALGNATDTATVEVSPGGLQLDLTQGTVTVAIAGGGFVVQVNGHKGGSWSVLTLTAGDSLTIRPGPWGNWCCLAFAGQIRAPHWLGAQATHAPSGLGGGHLTAGGLLHIDHAEPRPWRNGAIPCPVWARPHTRVQVVMGPQDRHFATETLADFLTRPFRLTAAHDRMGMRLDGPRLTPDAALSLPSEALMRGAVQVAGDGVASVLLADHQTTGGYPKIATLAGAETDRFAQMRPGDVVRFDAISPQAALHLTRQRAASLRACLAGLARPAH